MTLQEYYTTRYKLIGDYPGNKLKVGQVVEQYFIQETHNEGICNYCYITEPFTTFEGKVLDKDDVENYPNLFQLLDWWEERKIEDMPEYVQSTVISAAWKIKEWDFKNSRGLYYDDIYIVLDRTIIPASLEDYERSVHCIS